VPLRNQRLRLLIVEDDPAQAKLAQVVLAQQGFRDTTVVDSAAAALERAPTADLVLLDIQLPDGNGLDVLRRLRERSSRPAVVIVTAHGAEQIAVEALRLGADDYISKDAGFMELLPRVVERVRRTIALRDTLEAAEQEIVVAERRAAVGEMTVALHHELNNPLMAALTELALLREERGLSPVVARGLEVIAEALERIRAAVKRAGEADASRSVDYLTDLVRMTDLDTPGALIASRGRAVVVAQDPGLVRVISVLLRRAAFEPETVGAPEELSVRLREGPPPHVVVIAGEFGGGDERWNGIELTGARPWALVVASRAAQGGIAKGMDLMVPLPFDPGTFPGQVIEAVERRTGRR
jgi:DNA-binding response OmpR family regulator